MIILKTGFITSFFTLIATKTLLIKSLFFKSSTCLAQHYTFAL